jgi:hypothetical protein
MKVSAFYSIIAAAGMFVLPVSTAMAQPALSGVCRGMYAKYEVAASPKAFAVSNTGGCGWKGPGGGISLNEAKKRAVAFCVANGGRGCVVVESER